jgi:shikimate kinase
VTPVVVLVGAPGAGKTTVARRLADRLGTSVRDTDVDVERSTGSSVQDLFVEHGEAHFRELEAAAVASALQEHDGVLALGGGAVLHPGTQRLLREQRVVFLDVSLSAAAQRVGLGTNRPLLLGNVRATMKALLDARRPVYEDLATHTVVTDDLTADDVAARIHQLIQENATP